MEKEKNKGGVIKNYTNIDNFILEGGYLNAMEQIIYIQLRKYDYKGNGCFPCIKTLAEKLNCSENTVRKYLSNLESKKFIKIYSRTGKSNLYILFPSHTEANGDSKDGDFFKKLKYKNKDQIGVLMKFYQRNFPTVSEEFIIKKLIELYEMFHNAGIVKKAMEISVAKNIKLLGYVEEILMNWQKHGVKTIEEAESYGLKYD